VWNDLNGDLQFQRGDATWNGFRYVGGEFGAGNVTTTIPNPNPFDRSLRRTYRTEVTAGVDHELLPGMRLSVTYISRRTRDPQGTVEANVDQWGEMFTPIQVREQGRDGRFDTADDQLITVYNQNPGVTLTSQTVNDDRLGNRYDGVEIVATQRYRRGMTFLAGYTYSNERVDLTSLANPNAALVNAEGVSGGRRHNFKATGSYLLPYGVTVGAELPHLFRSADHPDGVDPRLHRDGDDKLPQPGQRHGERGTARDPGAGSAVDAGPQGRTDVRSARPGARADDGCVQRGELESGVRSSQRHG
jgi:hypothetical protein